MMTTKVWNYFALLFAIAATALLCIATARADDIRSAVSAGQKAPAFQTQTVNGKTVNFPGDYKGKVVLLDFWATWCGPCREWEPHFEKVADQLAGQEPDVVFLQVNCDEDETLVGPYLAEEKPKTSVLFADGLDVLLQVNSFPTTLILDRSGKIAYRAEGFDPDDVEAVLGNAVRNALAAQKEHAQNSTHGVKSAL